jgi:hypothetical protein
MRVSARGRQPLEDDHLQEAEDDEVEQGDGCALVPAEPEGVPESLSRGAEDDHEMDGR